jgi:hypothetical protein
VPYYQFLWNAEVVEHLAQHGVSTADFEEVVSNPDEIGESRSTGRPCCWGETADGRLLFCVIRGDRHIHCPAGDGIRDSSPQHIEGSEMVQENTSTELLDQLRRDRALIADELPELAERHERMLEAQAEDTFSGHLRRAVHHSGRLVREIAADAGISSELLCDFLEGTRTLRSDVLDRLAQAVGATVAVEPRRPARQP